MIKYTVLINKKNWICKNNYQECKFMYSKNISKCTKSIKHFQQIPYKNTAPNFIVFILDASYTRIAVCTLKSTKENLNCQNNPAYKKKKVC